MELEIQIQKLPKPQMIALGCGGSELLLESE